MRGFLISPSRRWRADDGRIVNWEISYNRKYRESRPVSAQPHIQSCPLYPLERKKGWIRRWSINQSRQIRTDMSLRGSGTYCHLPPLPCLPLLPDCKGRSMKVRERTSARTPDQEAANKRQKRRISFRLPSKKAGPHCAVRLFTCRKNKKAPPSGYCAGAWLRA